MSLTPEQIAKRQTGIGASEIGVIAGLHPRWKPIDIYRRKKGLVDDDGNAFSEWGHRLEDAVATAYAEKNQVRLVNPQETFRHPRHSIVLASPDRLILDATEKPVGDLQIKTAAGWKASEWGTGEDDVPEVYLCQVQWELGILHELHGMTEGVLAVLLGGHDYREHPVHFDPEFFGLLVEKGQRWWRDHIEKDEPPLDDSKSSAEFVRASFPTESARSIVAPPEAGAFADALRVAKAAKKIAEADELAATTQLQRIMGDAAAMKGNGWSITWKTVKGGTYTRKDSRQFRTRFAEED